jgi:hypothetical protein
MKTKSSSGLKVTAGIKAGGFAPNHTGSGLKVRAGVKAGGFAPNHTSSGLKVKAGVKAGSGTGIWQNNHSLRLMA